MVQDLALLLTFVAIVSAVGAYVEVWMDRRAERVLVDESGPREQSSEADSWV